MDATDAEPCAAARFGLAWDRLALEDAARSAYLDARCRKPDADEPPQRPRPAPAVVVEDGVRVTGTCKVDGCGRPVYAGKGCGYGMCAGHARRKERGQDMLKPLRRVRLDAWARVKQAACELGCADNQRESELAEGRLRAALYHWIDQGGADRGRDGK